MSPVPVAPRRVFGVDFSAARDAGKHIWVCRAHPGREGVRVESVDPLSTLPGGAVSRGDALRALVQKIVESPRSAWGLDFSFALPAEATVGWVPAAAGHGQLIDAVAACGDADGLRARCRKTSPAGERRRRTDDDASTPLSPYNLRTYKQTYYGITEVIRPLRVRPEVAVLPFDALPQAASAGASRLPFNRSARGPTPHVYLMEVCPASVLVTLDHPRKGYKGRGTDAADRRRAILARLTREGLVRPMPRALRRRIVDNHGGDAVDAVLAAVGAWRGYRDYDHAQIRGHPRYGVEGFVYR